MAIVTQMDILELGLVLGYLIAEYTLNSIGGVFLVYNGFIAV